MVAEMDFARHNEEVAQLWEDYHARKPARVPDRKSVV